MREAVSRIEAGMIGVNSFALAAAESALGGIKASAWAGRRWRGNSRLYERQLGTDRGLTGGAMKPNNIKALWQSGKPV